MGDPVTVDGDEWEATQARLRALEAAVERLTAGSLRLDADPGPSVDADRHGVEPGRATSRRRALIGMAAAGAGAAALVAGPASPAAANGQGQSFTLGDPTNSATNITAVTGSLNDRPVLRGANAGTNTGVHGVKGVGTGINSSAGVVGDSRDGAGVLGLSTNATAVSAFSQNAVGVDAASGTYADDYGPIGSMTPSAVRAASQARPGLVAISKTSRAIWAYSQQAVGISAESRDSHAIEATATGTGRGVVARSQSGAALYGFGTTGNGVLAQSSFGAALRIVGSSSGGPQGLGVSGELTVDALGAMWAGIGSGTFRKVTGPGTAGALHVLPAPARVYDSRPGSLPSVGPKTKLVPNQARTVDTSANSSSVPNGASAVLLTILLVNAANGNGNITVWANGVARPQANTLVWGGATGRFTATATSAVDPLTKVQLLASLPTDVVVDVVGYYR